jgi:hypothetical protein
MPTIDVTVAASADDAAESSGGTMDLTLNPLPNVDGANEWNAFRFTGITIPAGATITAAYLTVQMTSSSLDEPDVTFFGLDTAAPGTFTTTANDISGRARTTASADWSNTNAGTSDVQTSSLVTIVQELVDSYAPYSSGAIGFAMRSRANDGLRDTSIRSYDNSTTLCARLHIDYTEAGGGRTTKNTRAWPLGTEIGMGWRL